MSEVAESQIWNEEMLIMRYFVKNESGRRRRIKIPGYIPGKRFHISHSLHYGKGKKVRISTSDQTVYVNDIFMTSYAWP